MNRFARVAVRAARSHSGGSHSARFSVPSSGLMINTHNVSVRHFSRNGRKRDSERKDENGEDDAALQSQFDNLFGRFDAFLGSFSEERNAYDLHQELLSKNSHKLWLSTWGLTIDLLNPLLRKYKGAFEFEEFCEGVRMAFPVMNNAIALTINAAIEPSKYADQKTVVEEQSQLLHDTTSDKFRKNLQVIIREQKLLCEMGMKWNIASSTKKLQGVVPRRVKLRVVHKANDNSDEDDDVLGSGGTAVISASEQLAPPKLRLPRSKPTSQEIGQYEEDLRRYKVGAVIATVEVVMIMVQTADLQTIILDKPSGNAELDEIKRQALKGMQAAEISRTEMWVFESCISGHVPQAWTLSEIRPWP